MTGPDRGGSSPAERYLAHLDMLSEGREPRFQPIGEPRRDRPRMSAIVYTDLPEPGHLTAFTYGLSLTEHPSWRHGKPELMISVRSQDIGWALAIAFMAEYLPGQCPFSYGNVIHFGEVCTDSAMTAFVVFAPSVLAPEDYRDIDLGSHLVSLACCYPIHASEAEFIEREGLEPFWKMDDVDLESVTRPPVV